MACHILMGHIRHSGNCAEESFSAIAVRAAVGAAGRIGRRRGLEQSFHRPASNRKAGIILHLLVPNHRQ